LKGFHKRFAENTVPIAERLKIGDSVDKNSIFFNFLSGKFLQTADMLIALKGDGFTVNLNDVIISGDPKRE
jgi:hypothetical protein